MQDKICRLETVKGVLSSDVNSAVQKFFNTLGLCYTGFEKKLFAVKCGNGRQINKQLNQQINFRKRKNYCQAVWHTSCPHKEVNFRVTKQRRFLA